MRNLKKVLSLALAMVMLLGMMVVGAGAATSFKDDDVIQNKEAVTVVSTIGVLQGIGDNTFNPKGTLTRAEAAVVIAKLDLGADAASALTATNAATFKDVAEGSGYGWAKAYIDYCAGSGYIVGDGNGNFLPGKTVTSVEFATMVSRMLGYRDKNEGLDDPAQWVIKATALARKAGLSTNIVMSSTEGMSRDEMAQMAFNALTAPMVEYEGLDITIGEVAITSKAKVRTHTASSIVSNTTYDGEEIKSNITPIRLCEEKFPTLKLDRQDELDKFGRRCSVWTYKGLKIAGSEATIEPNLAYNTKVTKDTVADWAKMEGLEAAAKMELWINGKRVTPTDFTTDEDGKPLDEPLKVGTQGWISRYTAPGREVEVYMNKDNLSVVERVVVVDTVLAEVTKENSDETISVKLMKTGNAANPDKVTTGAITLNTTVGYGDVKKGDIVLVQGYGTEKLSKDTTISSVEVAPIVTGFATFKGYNTQTKVSYIKVDGEDYSDAYSVVRDFAVQDFSLNTEDLDCTLYLDNHGNIMKAIPGKDPNAVKDNLVAVKESYNALNNGKIVHMVKGVISNGETVTWQVKNSSVAENAIYTWAKADGVYTLSAIRDKDYTNGLEDASKESWVATVGTGSTINFKSNDVFGKDEANKVMYSDTVKFIFVGDSGVSVLNGRQTYELDAGKTVAQAFKDGEITAVFINEDPDVVDVSDLIYIHSTYRENDQIVDVDGKKVQYHGYTAYNAKGEAIEEFLGTEEDMADSFHKTKKTDDGKAYLPNEDNRTVSEHTMTKGVVAKANGLSGDAFVLVDMKKDDGLAETAEGTHYDFMGRKSTKVVDLSGSKLYIEEISEINSAVNDGYYVEVAVIYNAISDTPAQYPSQGDVREAVTVFVTTVVKPDADHKIPTHTPSDDPNQGGETETGDTFTMTAPKGVVYSVDQGKTWASSVQIKSEKDFEIWMKPEFAADGWFFAGAPEAVGGTELAEAIAGASGSSDQAATPVTGQSGVYKFTLASIDATYKITDVVKQSEVTATVLKLTNSYVDTSATAAKVYLRFEDASGVRSDGTGIDAAGKQSIAGDVLEAAGYQDVLNAASNGLTFRDGRDSHTVATGDIYINCVRYTGTDGKLKLAKLDSAAETITLTGESTQVAVVYDKDGKVIDSALGNGTVTASASLDDGKIVLKNKSADAEKTANTKAPAMEADETIKIESTDNTDKTGFLTQDSAAYGGAEADYDYSKATGKLTTATLQIAAADNDAQIRITQTNNALKIVPDGRKESETVRVTTLDTTAIGTEAPNSHSGVIEYEYLVMEGGGNITIKVERWKASESTSSDASTVYTITIDPSTMTFK